MQERLPIRIEHHAAHGKQRGKLKAVAAAFRHPQQLRARRVFVHFDARFGPLRKAIDVWLLAQRVWMQLRRGAAAFARATPSTRLAAAALKTPSHQKRAP